MTARRHRKSFRQRVQRSCGALLLAACWSLNLAAVEAPYAGSAECAACHEQAYAAWKASHHYQAMLPADTANVLGAFDGRSFEYAGVTSRFFRRDDRFMVETDDENGELKEFEIAYTFGFYPLQQYLVAFPGGRYQALNIVWDSRPEAAGGQRWIHLYPEDALGEDEPVRHDDIVHWTGSFQNWNGRCAACHSTGLEKNYAAASRSYATRWQEINVACEACHGPAAAHLEWARAAANEDRAAPANAPDHKGFGYSLADRGSFGPQPNGSSRILTRQDGNRPTTQVEICAGCHARRSELDEDHPSRRFDDRFHLSLIEPGLYFPDGQVRDEVYVYGSFLQSRMSAAGVVCSNCHEPHSGALRAPGNALCSQCHAPAFYDQASHHHHQPGAPGSACVDCHMPSRTYMVVDDRRDHSFRVPEPRLSRQLGVPNACNQCHEDRDPQWAADALAGWGVGAETRASHAAVLAGAWAGRTAALPALLALAGDDQKPAILRASAVLASGNFPIRDTLASIAQVLYSDDNLVRTAAVRTLDQLPVEQRYALLKSLVADPVKSVRMAVARQLVEVPLAQLPAAEARALGDLHKEYLESLRSNADMPEEQMNIGLYHLANGDPAAAEKAYREALKLAPAFVPALLNLADLYRANGLDSQAQPLLSQAIELAPGDAAPHYALGLLLIRQQQLQAALNHLQQAAALAPDNVRYQYVHGVALWESGRQQEAVATLESALANHPGNPDLMSALASYYQQLGEEEKLRALQP
jgi:predicted CXXCH cytochrome family protein